MTAVCEQCHEVVPYDGGRDAILNMSTCLVSHDLLRSYLYSFLNGRYTYLILSTVSNMCSIASTCNCMFLDEFCIFHEYICNIFI